MYKEVELYFHDLNESGQEKVMEAAGVKNPSEMNWSTNPFADIIPLAIIGFEDESDA